MRSCQTKHTVVMLGWKKPMHIGGLICNQSSGCYRIVWRVLIVTKFIALILLLPDSYSEEMVEKL